MKRGLIAICLAVIAAAGVHAEKFANETLKYVISYKWGLVHKDAGEATLTLRNSGNNYNVMLSARTKPWADKIFMVRDTLKATIQKNTLKPLSYTKISHEGGKYGRDHIAYSYHGSTVGGKCTRYKEKKGKVTTSEISLTAGGSVWDMLSVFYYLRSISYDKLSKNKVIKATVFSGSKSETITIRSLGIETVKLRNKQEKRAYHIRFRFTSGGGKKSSEDMDSWIGVDPPHIPYQLEGSLPVGKVKCYYTGS